MTGRAVPRRPWRVKSDGWIAGRRVREGDQVQLTEVAARYENVEPVSTAEPKPKPRRTRAKPEVTAEPEAAE